MTITRSMVPQILLDALEPLVGCHGPARLSPPITHNFQYKTHFHSLRCTPSIEACKTLRQLPDLWYKSTVRCTGTPRNSALCKRARLSSVDSCSCAINNPPKSFFQHLHTLHFTGDSKTRTVKSHVSDRCLLNVRRSLLPLDVLLFSSTC